MTKAQAQELKKAINSGAHYTTYFSSKTGTLSVRAYTYNNNAYDETAESSAINELINKLHGEWPYEIKRRTYQGFIHDTDLIFS